MGIAAARARARARRQRESPASPEFDPKGPQIRKIRPRIVPVYWMDNHQFDLSSRRMFPNLGCAVENVLGIARRVRMKGDHIPIAIRSSRAFGAASAKPNRRTARRHSFVNEVEDLFYSLRRDINHCEADQSLTNSFNIRSQIPVTRDERSFAAPAITPRRSSPEICCSCRDNYRGSPAICNSRARWAQN